MGKNQAYKAMQRSRLGSSSAAPDEVEDGMVDGSFHSPEWHAARLASLKTSHTVTWEEYKKKQKALMVSLLGRRNEKGELEADKDRMMREYRAQLDAERARKLSQGSNHSSGKSSRNRDKDKDKDSKTRSRKKRKHSKKYSDSSSSSSSESSSSDDEERESKRSRSRLKRRHKEKKKRSKSKHSSSENKEADGPLPLSRFFGAAKS